MVSGCASILSGMVYARYGQGVYAVIAVMAAAGGLVIRVARGRLEAPLIDQPQSKASGG
jgi:PPP family 3-phenylpropionic acid transporter